jgi:hypothetical protein
VESEDVCYGIRRAAFYVLQRMCEKTCVQTDKGCKRSRYYRALRAAASVSKSVPVCALHVLNGAGQRNREEEEVGGAYGRVTMADYSTRFVQTDVEGVDYSAAFY